MSQATKESFWVTTKGGFRELLNPINGKIERFQIDSHNSDSIANCDRKINVRKDEILELATRKLGRPPTSNEFMEGRCLIEDDRDYLNQLSDSNFQPVKKQTESTIDKMLKDVDEEIENKRISKLPPLELRRHHLEEMRDREDADALEAKQQAKHLEKVAPTLAVLERLIINENWDLSGSEKMRATLRKAKAQLLESGGCGVTLKQLLSEVDTTLSERKAAQQASLDQQAIEIIRQMSEHQIATESLVSSMEDESNESTS